MANGVNPAATAAAAAAADGSLQRARLLLSDEVAAFRQRLIGLLERRPLTGVELSRETLAVVEAAGKEPPLRRARLRIILEMAVEFYRARLRQAAVRQDLRLTEVEACLADTLEALAGIDRNANLGILIDAWSARLERAAAQRRLADCDLFFNYKDQVVAPEEGGTAHPQLPAEAAAATHLRVLRATQHERLVGPAEGRPDHVAPLPVAGVAAADEALKGVDQINGIRITF